MYCDNYNEPQLRHNNTGSEVDPSDRTDSHRDLVSSPRLQFLVL